MADLRELLQSGLGDRYRFDRELGRGGMATVFLVHDLRHKRPVALKVLHPESAHTLGPERFQREIETVARLQHPHTSHSKWYSRSLGDVGEFSESATLSHRFPD
jgi:serine/threonine protein kinase